MASEIIRGRSGAGADRVIRVRKNKGADTWRISWAEKDRYLYQDYATEADATRVADAKRKIFAGTVAAMIDPSGTIRAAAGDARARALEPEWWVETVAAAVAIAGEQASSADVSELGTLINAMASGTTAARKMLEMVLNASTVDDFSNLTAAEAKLMARELQSKIEKTALHH